MKGIQIILLMGIGFISIVLVKRLRNRIFELLFLILLIGVATLFILWPEITNQIAQKLGVGRGADMVFYICILIFWLIIVKLWDRIRKLELMFTKIIRNNALDNAKKLPDEEKTSS